MIDLAKKDKRPDVPRNGEYSPRLERMPFIPVVFCDVKKRRSVLVDGASALLYMVRAYLHERKGNRAFPGWCFSHDKLREDQDPKGWDAAIGVLADFDNREQKLYQETRRSWKTFEGLVMDFMEMIEYLANFCSKNHAPDGFSLTHDFDVHRKLVGFEYEELLGPNNSIASRMYSMKHIKDPFRFMPSWGNFVESIGALVVFGSDFGHLLTPKESGGLCKEWKTLPADKDFLATTIHTLKLIHQTSRGKGSIHPFIQNFDWAGRHDDPLHPCACSGEASQHKDPVHLILPMHRAFPLPYKFNTISLPPVNENSNGAVIFTNYWDTAVWGGSINKIEPDKKNKIEMVIEKIKHTLNIKENSPSNESSTVDDDPLTNETSHSPTDPFVTSNSQVFTSTDVNSSNRPTPPTNHSHSSPPSFTIQPSDNAPQISKKKGKERMPFIFEQSSAASGSSSLLPTINTINPFESNQSPDNRTVQMSKKEGKRKRSGFDISSISKKFRRE